MLGLKIVFIITTYQQVREYCDDNSSENLLVVLIGFYKNLGWLTG